MKDNQYIINPYRGEDYHLLLEELHSLDKLPAIIAHLWGIGNNEDTENNGNDVNPQLEFDRVDDFQHRGFYSLLFFAQAIGNLEAKEKIQIHISSQIKS